LKRFIGPTNKWPKH